MNTETGVLLMVTQTRRIWSFISGTRVSITAMQSDRNVATVKDGLGVHCTPTSPTFVRIEGEVGVRFWYWVSFGDILIKRGASRWARFIIFIQCSPVLVPSKCCFFYRTY